MNRFYPVALHESLLGSIFTKTRSPMRGRSTLRGRKPFVRVAVLINNGSQLSTRAHPTVLRTLPLLVGGILWGDLTVYSFGRKKYP